MQFLSHIVPCIIFEDFHQTNETTRCAKGLISLVS